MWGSSAATALLDFLIDLIGRLLKYNRVLFECGAPDTVSSAWGTAGQKLSQDMICTCSGRLRLEHFSDQAPLRHVIFWMMVSKSTIIHMMANFFSRREAQV